MATYYLNAGSISQDGLTPETGFHTLAALSGTAASSASPFSGYYTPPAFTFVDGDIIEVVDNGLIIETHILPVFTVNITIRSWSGNTNKPTIQNATPLFFAHFNLYDIVFTTTSIEGGGATMVQTYSDNFNIERCEFLGVAIYVHDDALGVISKSNANISNNIFTSTISNNAVPIGFWADVAAWSNIYICNNTYYGNPAFQNCLIYLLNFNALVNTNYKILNNIVFAIESTSIVLVSNYDGIYGVGSTLTNSLLDYNDFYLPNSTNFDATSPPPAGLTIGAHNLLLNNPLFVDVATNNFKLQNTSPCIDAGINNSVQSSVPIVDFVGRPRPFNTDIGAYEIGIYYINTASTTQNGLTPTTGFHKLSSLVSLVFDDDVIEVVYSAVSVPETVGTVIFTKRITIRSYVDNALKPIIDTGLTVLEFQSSINLYDIVFKTNPGNADGVYLRPYVAAVTNIERCVFYVYMQWYDSGYALQNISVKNNIFTSGTNIWITMNDNSMQNIYICNNIFYNSYGLSILFAGGPNTPGKIATNIKLLNNICYADADPNYALIILSYDVSQLVNCLIDYNCTFTSVGGDQINAPPSVIGAHNLLSTNPLFANAAIEDFNLQPNSLCINAGVDNNVQASVPINDFRKALRPQGAHTDIGAYEYAVIWYLNAGSVTEDGLTPATGYHKLSSLTTYITLVDGDIIEAVNNGMLAEPTQTRLTIHAGITLRSWSGNANKPTIGFYAGDYIEFPKYTNIYDINFVASNTYIQLQFTGDNINIERCSFNYSIFIYVADIIALGITNKSNLRIVNNTFLCDSNMVDQAYIGIIVYLDTASWDNINICNNSFYGYINIDMSDYSIAQNLYFNHVRILNNAFYNNSQYVSINPPSTGQTFSSPCVYIETYTRVTNSVADYNIFYGLNYATSFPDPAFAGVILFPAEIIGLHDIYNTDPLFIDATNNNFKLQGTSLAINSGLDNSIQPIIPTVDFDGVSRPQSAHTDIGAYEYVYINNEYKIPNLEFFQWQQIVKQMGVNTPPAAVKGDRYVVGASATGVWATHTRQIAYYTGSSWIYNIPETGWQVFDNNTSGNYYYNGTSWNPVVSQTATITY